MLKWHTIKRGGDIVLAKNQITDNAKIYVKRYQIYANIYTDNDKAYVSFNDGVRKIKLQLPLDLSKSDPDRLLKYNMLEMIAKWAVENYMEDKMLDEFAQLYKRK